MGIRRFNSLGRRGLYSFAIGHFGQKLPCGRNLVGYCQVVYTFCYNLFRIIACLLFGGELFGFLFHCLFDDGLFGDCFGEHLFDYGFFRDGLVDGDFTRRLFHGLGFGSLCDLLCGGRLCKIYIFLGGLLLFRSLLGYALLLNGYGLPVFNFEFNLLNGSALKDFGQRSALLCNLFSDDLFDCGLTLFEGIARKELLIGQAEGRLVLLKLGGQSGGVFKLADITHIADKPDFDSLAVEIAFEIFDMYFKNFAVVAEGRAAAKVGYAEILPVLDSDGDFIDAVLYGIFPIRIGQVDCREAENARTPVRAFNDLTLNEKVFAEKFGRALDVALVEAGFDERGGNFFAVGHNILYRHIPHTVFLIFGIVFERGRLALGALAEAKVLAAHVGLDIYFFLDCREEVEGHSLFKFGRIVDDEHEFNVIGLEHFHPLLEGVNYLAALAVPEHHYAQVEAVDFSLELGFFEQLPVAGVNGVETAENEKRGERVFVFSVFDDF